MHKRLVIFLIVTVTAFSQAGCGRLLEVLLAPEAVVGKVANDIAGTGAETLSGMSASELSDFKSTADEIDHIIQRNPDAVNTGRLSELRDKLNARPSNTGTNYNYIVRQLQQRRIMNELLPFRKGDILTINKPSNLEQTRRPDMRPDTQPTSTSLKPDNRPIHIMSRTPVRIR